MKIIYDNIIYSLQNNGGVSVYWSELLKRVKDDNNVDAYFVDYGDNSRNVMRKLFELPSDRTRIKNYNHLFTKVNSYVPFYINGSKDVLYHPSYYRYSPHHLTVNTVHDFINEKYRKGIPKYINSNQKWQALNRSDLLICISKNTKDDLLYYMPHLKYRQIEVVYHGVSTEFHPIIDSKLSNTFLFIGSRKSYKNFKLAVSLTKICKEFSLLIIGGGDLTKEEKRLLDCEIRERYSYKRHVDNQELNSIYNNVFALIYPSSYEGFGMPILEAMKAGCPFVALNTSSIREITNNSNILIEPRPTGELLEQMVQLVEKLKINEIRSDVIADNLITASKYSWDRCYKETIRSYKKLL